MSEPKKLLETALFGLLDGGLSWPVYNTVAAGETIEYVVFQSGGSGNDDDYHAKDRGVVFEYQVNGISTDRATALDMAVALGGVMDTAGASLSVAGWAIIRVSRVGQVDYTQVEPDGVSIHHVGGIYEIELEEA